MSGTRELTDAEFERMRVRGELECRCIKPEPVLLPGWGGYQCDRCLKIWYER
jgi:hypothetical protein